MSQECVVQKLIDECYKIADSSPGTKAMAHLLAEGLEVVKFYDDGTPLNFARAAHDRMKQWALTVLEEIQKE